MELYIEPIHPQRNFVNGRLLKGCVPFNKGLKWNDYMPKESQEKCRKCLVHKGRKDIGAWNKKTVIVFTPEGIRAFKSSVSCAKFLHRDPSNIRRACRKGYKCGGYVVKNEEDL
jgi:hypothetical protein